MCRTDTKQLTYRYTCTCHYHYNIWKLDPFAAYKMHILISHNTALFIYMMGTPGPVFYHIF